MFYSNDVVLSSSVISDVDLSSFLTYVCN